jgi:hypothetical protein
MAETNTRSFEVDGRQATLRASRRVENMLGDAPKKDATIEWLLAHFLDRSPEMLFLAFTPVAVVPATSTFAGALLFVAAVPLILDRRGFLVPTFLARQTIPVEKIEWSFKRLLAVLKFYETYALRRPQPLARHHTRLVGALVATLSAALLIPFRSVISCRASRLEQSLSLRWSKMAGFCSWQRC